MSGIPTHVSASIEGEDYLASTPGAKVEKYGPDFAGTIKIRWPKLGDEIQIRCTVHAAIEAYGANPRLVSPWIYSLVSALTYVQVLKDGDPPSWFSEDAALLPKAEAAIVRVYTLLQEKLDAAKKDSAGTGEAPLPNA